MKYLNPKEIKNYHEDGFLVVRNIFTKNECADLKKTLIDEIHKGKDIYKKFLDNLEEEKFDRNKIASVPRGINNGYLQDIAHRNIKFMELAKDKRLISIAGQIFGEDITKYRLYRSTSIFKNSEVTVPTPWHQDMVYWKGGANKLSIWIPFNKVIEKNGALQYIPGSQNKSCNHTDIGDGKYPVLELQNIDESKKVIIEVEMGDIVIHHPYVIHSSRKNELGIERYSITFTYQPATDISHHREGQAELIEEKIGN